MSNAASWVHGNAAEVEAADERTVETIRRGWASHFLMRDFNEDYWFHFPIPTLPLLGDAQLKLAKVYVLFTTDGAAVRTIHIYDGARRIKTFEGLDLSGDFSVNIIDGCNSWLLDEPLEITKGIGVSVGVQIVQGGRLGLPEILFTAAGIEYIS